MRYEETKRVHPKKSASAVFWVIVSGGDKGQFFVARGQYKALLLGSWWHWSRKGGTGWYLVVLSQFRAALVCTYTRVLS